MADPIPTDPCCTSTSVASTPDASAPGDADLVYFRIATMDCMTEEAEIRRAMASVPNIRHLRFELGARRLGIGTDAVSLGAAIEAIRGVGFDPQPMAAPTTRGDAATAPRAAAAKLAAWRLGGALVLALAAESIEYLWPGNGVARAAGLAVAAMAVYLAGVDTFTKGVFALRRGKLNINALMSVAVTGAFLIGKWPEAAMVMALYAIAELIEARAADRARNAIAGLLALAPETADVQQPDGSWKSQSSASVGLGMTVRVRPGERVPLDGVVLAGHSAIDQSPVTGESLPVDKAPGDAIFAGTVNQDAELQVRVTAAATNSTLARIIAAVEQAQASRAPTQNLIDRFAAVYTPLVFALALAVALLGPWVAGSSWMDAVYKALVLLVVACPCALVIATPVTVVSALTAAARRGILVKGGIHLESARLLKVLALDKTGTLTEGKPRMIAWEPLADGQPDLAVLARSLAQRSDHPVSVAIAQGLPGEALPVERFAALPGRGTEGQVAERNLWLGNRRLAGERSAFDAALAARLAEHEAQGRTVTLLGDGGRALALFAVADTIKPTSQDAVARLQALGIRTVLLSGDNTTTARAVAEQAGIAEAQGELLPEGKLDALDALRKQHGFAGMVGDGINDAPALSRADIGFAMGAAGTDVAIEAADVVVMNDDLRRIPEAVVLSRHTHSVMWQNIVFAIGIKVVFMVLAIAGIATMWMAVFADMGATLLVVANGLRMLRPSRAAN